MWARSACTASKARCTPDTAKIVGSVTSTARSTATSAERVSWPSEGGQSMRTSSYWASRAPPDFDVPASSAPVPRGRAASRRDNRPRRWEPGSGWLWRSMSSEPTSTSIESSQELGAIEVSSVAGEGFSSASAMVVSLSAGSRAVVELPCGSRSTTRVRSPWRAAAPARPRVTVVLPTPPFRLSTPVTYTSATYRLAHESPMGEHYGVAVNARPPAPTAVDVVARALRDELAAARARRGDGSSLRVLDVGGGSGTWAVPLAVDGCEVTVVDSSANALAVLRSRARDAGVADQVRAVQGDVDALADIDGHVGADLVLGHGLLEYVDDPASAVRALAAATAPGGAVSVLVAGRWAAVLGRVVAGRVAEARRLLADPAGRWGRGDPMLRRMDTDEIRELIERDGDLVVEQVRGHRVLADLVPENSDGGFTASDLAALEELAADTPPLRDLASRIHVMARRPAQR